MSGYAGLVGQHVRIGVILQDHGVVAVVELAQGAPDAEAASALVLGGGGVAGGAGGWG